MKYIVTEDNSFAIFSDGESHKQMAKVFRSKVIGAGFCTLARLADSEQANVHCFGESISLGIESRPEDEEIINRKIQN